MIRRTSAVAFLAILSCCSLLADGGTIQFRKQAGAFRITLLSEPSPVRVGKVDLSVLCERTINNEPVKDAQVLIHLRRPGAGDILEIALPAKRGKNKNQVLYTAMGNLESPGKWPVRIAVSSEGEEAVVTGSLEVLLSEPAIVTYWPFFVAVPLLALVFAINLRLRRGRELRHPRAKK